jgi:hypothetical protein
MTKSKVPGLPVISVSQAILDTGSGEQAISYARQSIALIMSNNDGTLVPGQIDQILNDLEKYFSPTSSAQDDNIQFLTISTHAVRTGTYERAQLLRFDGLSPYLRFTSWTSISTLENRAVATNNMKARLIIAQIKANLSSLFKEQGFGHRQNTIRPVTLELERQAFDDTGDEPYQFKFMQKYEGFAVSYKTPENYGRIMIALCKDSNETSMNLRQALMDAKLKDLYEQQRKLYEKQRVAEELDAKQQQMAADLDARQKEQALRLAALENWQENLDVVS